MHIRTRRLTRFLAEAGTIGVVVAVMRLLGAAIGSAIAWGTVALILINFGEHLVVSRLHLDAAEVHQDKNAFLTAQNTVTRRGLRMLDMLQVLAIPLAIAVTLWATWGEGLRRISYVLHAQSRPDTCYFLTSDPVIVFIPVFMASMLASALLMGGICMVVCGQLCEVWRQYSHFDSVHHLPRRTRLIAQALIGLCVVSAVGDMLFIDSYVRVSTHGIGVNGFWSFRERLHTWDSVEKAERRFTADKGGSEPSCRYRVIFDDGSYWQTVDPSFARSFRSQAAAVRYTARHSHKRIEETWDD